MAIGTTRGAAEPPKSASAKERKRWEELSRIKRMPIPMAQKRELKAQLQKVPKVKLKGWNRVKRFFFQAASNRPTHRRNFVFWQSSLRTIEVRCGTSIVNVFLFIKWTLYLNIAISAIIIIFLILPYFISGGNKREVDECPADWNNKISIMENLENSTDKNSTSDSDPAKLLADCCRDHYLNDAGLTEKDVELLPALAHVFDRHLYSPLFYGFYHRDIVHPFKYNYAMAYVLVTAAIFGLSLILMVRQVGRGIKGLILVGEGEFYKYCNLIFAGWDHYTKDEAGAKFKRKILKHEMRIALQAEKFKSQKNTRKQKWQLFFRRLVGNLVCIGLEIAVGFLIFYVFDYVIAEKDPQLQTILGFAPSLIIGIVNAVLPLLFRIIGQWERYSPGVQTTVLLIRTLFVRMLSIIFLGFKFYTTNYCSVEEGYCYNCAKYDDPKIEYRTKCWESLFGQQLYLVIITDLGLKVVLVFGVEYVRLLIGKYFHGKIFQKIGTMKFNIVRHSLDIVYIQSLSWLGLYFAPFIPILVCFYCFVIFYMKKFTVLVTSTAVPETFRTTRTATVFIATKLISFTVVTLTIGVVVGLLETSRDCGPFKEYGYAWEAVEKGIFPEPRDSTIDSIMYNLKSPGVTTPIAIILFLVAYYYYAIAQANKNMVDTLRHLLILEGQDKQYLFARLNAMRSQTEGTGVHTSHSTVNEG